VRRISMDARKDPRTREPSTPPPRRRFRVEKLEERIAPAKGGKATNNCPGGSGGGGHLSSNPVSVYTSIF
jgi:hypothetical protein